MRMTTTNAVSASVFFCCALAAQPATDYGAYDPARPAVFQAAPNCLLMHAIEGRRSGYALDIGMGSGGNALAQAERGWRDSS